MARLLSSLSLALISSICPSRPIRFGALRDRSLLALLALLLVGGSVAKLALCAVECAEDLLKIAIDCDELRCFDTFFSDVATENPTKNTAFQTKIER